MTNAHSFPLLRLPDLAREHVVKVMNVREQYLLSTLSKRSKIIVKNGVRLLPYRFDMMLGCHECTISIQRDGTDHSFEFLISRYCNPAVAGNPNRLCLKLESIKKVSSELLPFLSDLFKIARFNLEADRISNYFLEDIWTSIKSLEIEIYKLEVQCFQARIINHLGEKVEKSKNEIFKWVMENCRDVKRLTNNCRTSQDFSWNPQEPYTLEYLSLCNAPWLTIEKLTRLFPGCRFFAVDDDQHQLTTDDLKQIIEIWINGWNIEYFGVAMNQAINLNLLLEGIEKMPVQRARIENRLRYFDPGNAFKIRQKSGKEAVVCFLQDRYFKITTHCNSSKCDFWDVEEEEDDDEF